MASKGKNMDHNEEDEEEEEELNFDKQDGAKEDDDFDFKEKAKAQGSKKDDKTQVIQNNHFDEALNLSDNGSDEYNSGDENQQQEKEESHTEEEEVEIVKTEPKRPGNVKAQALQKKEDDSGDEEGKKNIKIEGLYDPADYASLNVSTEITELFKYITRYKPAQVDIETKLKAFIPDYVPAVGEVDAFLKNTRPDNQPEPLGLSILDEPTLNQSKKAKLDLMFNEVMKRNKEGKNINVHSIENADKNPKEVMAWINDVSEIHKKKQAPTVSYSKMMPEIDSLMQVWPAEIEDALGELMLPTEEIDFSLGDYSKLACVLLDIPIHGINNNKNIVESLHVLFTLFSEFKANQHFQQQQKAEGFENEGGNTMEIN